MSFPPYPVIDLPATGERIREIRENQGVAVQELAEYLGLASVQAIYKWQSGQSLPSVDHLFAMSVLFEIPMNDFLASQRMAPPGSATYGRVPAV